MLSFINVQKFIMNQVDLVNIKEKPCEHKRTWIYLSRWLPVPIWLKAKTSKQTYIDLAFY